MSSTPALPRPVILFDVGHQAVPAGGSYLSERTQRPAVLTDESCYPVSARCKVCEGPIRLAELRQLDWVHVAAPSPPANPGRGRPGAGEIHPPAPGTAAAGGED